LRSEFENLVEINIELTQRHKPSKSSSIFNKTANSSIFSQTKNTNFLNKELMFLIEDLQSKATSNGLQEDALIPVNTKKDKQILNYLK
jgi:hypothetical protein